MTVLPLTPPWMLTPHRESTGTVGSILEGVAKMIPPPNGWLFFFSSRRRHTRWNCDWSSDVCSSDLIDGQSTVPSAVRPDTYRSKPGSAHHVFDTVDDENLTGPKAVAVPGSLKAWCETLRRFGTMSLADAMQPAIKHAARGYAATPYLHECISDGAEAMLRDKAISAIYLPGGVPLNAGERVVQAEYAETLGTISRHGEAALYQGPLGDILINYMKANGGFIA